MFSLQEPADTHSTGKLCIRGQGEAARVQEALAVAKTKVQEACLMAPAVSSVWTEWRIYP